MEGPEAPGKTFRFGPYGVDTRAGELRKGGLRIKVRQKSFEILRWLLEHPGELVTREELRHRLWPEGVFVSFDDSLNSAVNRLRDALGGGRSARRYIETLHRRGYRFIAPVEVVPTGRPTLAVLPFANLSRDSEQEFLADAMADALTTELGSVSSLRVISRQSVLHLKGSRKTLPEIARHLKADNLVEGSVLAVGDSVRITAQLVQALPEQHLWAKAYACRMGDILTMQGQVARDIAEAVQVTLTTAEIGRLSRQRPVDPEGHTAYLKARHQLGQKSREAFKNCLQYLQKAIEKDPTHAPAYAQMALCYSLLGFWGHLPGREAYPRAKKAALNAIALDDALSVAHWVLGWVSWVQDWDLATCEAENLRALALNPSDEGAHMNYAVFLATVREDAARAIEEAKLALDLDPLSLNVNTDVAWTYLFVEDYERALQQARTTLDLFPDAFQAWYILGCLELRASRFDRAIEAFAKADAISPDALSMGYLGHAHARAGHLDTANSLLDQLLSRAKREYVPAKSLVWLYAGLGEPDRVIKWLEKAYRDRDATLFFCGCHAAPIFGPMGELIRSWTRERLPRL